MPVSKTIEKFLPSYVETAAESWRNLYFTNSGMSRLGHCCGFFRGLLAAGKPEIAEWLAGDLDCSLTNLNEFGGETPLDEKNAGPDITVPAYRVILYDDGTFGGFSLLWHRFVSNHDRLARAQ